MACICHFVLFLCPAQSLLWICAGSFPVWSGDSIIIFQLFRCRNWALNRDVFPTLVAGMWGCQHRGHPHVPICLYAPHVQMPTYIQTPPNVCMPTYLPSTSVCPPYYMFHKCHWNFGGNLYTPYVLGSFGASVHLSGISVSVSTSIASQFIIAIPVDPNDCGLLLYWTGCLGMSAMIHTVFPFFVVFLLCFKLLLPWLWLLFLQWPFCALVHHLSSPWPPPWWGIQGYWVSMISICHHHWHQGTLEVLLALPLCHSNNLCLRCLFRFM